MTKKQTFSKIFKLVFSLFVFSLFFISNSSNQKVLAGAGPCECEFTMNGGLCTGCYPSIEGTPCGDPDAEGPDNYCDNLQKKYACENARLYNQGGASTDDHYLCLKGGISNETDGGFTAADAEKGSWSEVFNQCFCSSSDLIQKIVNISIYATSIIALILIIYGGIKYITSQNNPDQIQDAKQILIAAISGLIFIIFSITLINLVDQQFNPSWGINLLNIF